MRGLSNGYFSLTRGKMSNWAKKLNDPRHRVNIFKRINRRLPWLKVVLVVVLTPMIIITVMAWRIWMGSPQRLQAEQEVAEQGTTEQESMGQDATGAEITDSGMIAPEDKVELYSELPAMPERTKTEIVDRADVRILRDRKRVIPAGKALLALTFDDGPSAETTPRLLDTLKQRRVPATFFVLGVMAQANPDMVRRADREGHEIGSHTMYHQNLTTLPEAGVRADVDEAKRVIRGILGREPSLTRVPYGSVNTLVANVVGTPLVNWSVDPSDWRKERRENSADIYYGVVDSTFDGAIVLMHDIYPTTVDKVGPIIDELRARGYEFVTVSELAEARGVTMAPGVEYRAFRP